MNALVNNQNALYTPPIINQYGQFQVGGSIGLRDINAAAQRDPFLRGGANLAADVAPISGSIRDAERLPGQYQAYQEAENPIQKALRAADMALSGGAMVADILPGLKAVGATGAALIPLMARRNDELTGITRALRNQQGIIGSTGAKTADLNLLAKAEDMKAAGASADDIYAETRWWLDHPDGKPRFEIDDNLADLDLPFTRKGTPIKHEFGDKLQGRTALPLHHAMSHDELVKAYGAEHGKWGPKSEPLPSVRLMDDPGSDYRGSFNERLNQVTLDGELSHLDANSVTLHELQHAIQKREGMARGGSVAGMAQLKYEALARLNYLNGEQGRIAREMDEVSAGYRQPKPGMEEKAQKLYSEYDAIMQEKMAFNPKLIQGDPLTGYHSLAGESEARLVQQRMNMTMDERLADPFFKNFDVPLDEQIIRK